MRQCPLCADVPLCADIPLCTDVQPCANVPLCADVPLCCARFSGPVRGRDPQPRARFLSFPATCALRPHYNEHFYGTYEHIILVFMSGRVHVHVCSCIFDNEHFYRLCTHDNVHFYIATSHVITVIEYLLVLFSMFASRYILRIRSNS